MSSKEEKPTLAGTQIKTRKRNIAVPLDPGSFADAVVQIIADAAEGDSVESNLQVAVKVLEGAELDFSRYGDTLFEVFFAGGRMASGGNIAPEGKKLATNVMASEPKREAIMPYVKLFQTLIRRRPFLIKSLENTLCKLLMTLDFFSAEGREKIAIATARIFAVKLGVLPDRVMQSLYNDRMVAKGTILEFITYFFKDFLETESGDDLVALLKKARIDERLMDFFPPQKRNLHDFEEHFKKEGLQVVVDYNRKVTASKHLDEMQTTLNALITADPPAPAADCLAAVKAKKEEVELPDTEVIKVIVTCLLLAVPVTGKNHQQISAAMMKQVKAYKSLLSTFAPSARLEAAILLQVQALCYEDNKLMKMFADIVRILYDADIVGEDTVIFWYKKGSSAKGRQVFQRDLEPFIRWLEEAEEEEED